MGANGQSSPAPTAPTAQLAERLRGQLVPATLTPFDTAGRVRHEQVAPYLTELVRDGIGGIAVGAHTGRGAHLDPDDLVRLVHTSATVTGLPVVAGLSTAGDAEGRDPVEALVPLAERLRDAGADALLVAPPRGADRATIVDLHQRLGARVEVPLVAFVLYERASGCQYDEPTVVELAALPWVAGVKLALLDDAVACQDLITVLRREAPDRVVLTGEDRMLGPSLLWGSQGALVGVGAALPSWSVEVLRTWLRGDYAGFVAASTRLDAFAAATFREPIEGYVQRMAWAAVWQRILSEQAALDPFGPTLPESERDALERALDGLT